MPEREKREKNEDPQSKTVRGERLRWSVWREAMVPYDIAEDPKIYSPRTARYGVRTHLYNRKTLQKLDRQCSNDYENCCGVYELKVKKGYQEAVVYVGSTHREAESSLYERIREYMTHGSHIANIIQKALDRDFEIHVRWLKIKEDLCPGIDEDELAEDVENEYLEKYDYAWNTRSNGKRRIVFAIGVKT